MAIKYVGYDSADRVRKYTCSSTDDYSAFTPDANSIMEVLGGTNKEVIVVTKYDGANWNTISEKHSAEVQTVVDGHTSQLSDIANPSIVEVTTDKILALADAGKIQKATAAATITVPPNDDVAFPISTEITIMAFTASDVAIAAGSGVTIRSKDAKLKIDGQYAGVSLFKVATNEWVLIGALKA